MNRSVLPKLMLLAGSALVGLLMLEVASRIVAPIFPGARRLDAAGDPVTKTSRDDFSYIPRLVYRQVSAEYDAEVTITEFGHRVPAPVGNPEVVFIGDSFTFGTGLKDEETFAFLFCEARQISCANLGRIDTGTHEQADILEHFLETNGWRPREVKLVMFAMTGSLMSGNDLRDNLGYDAGGKEKLVEAKDVSLRTRIAALLRADEVVLRYSNLARWLKLAFGPSVKSLLWPSADEKQLEAALQSTERGLRRIDALSRKYGFRYTVYLVHPVADLLRGTHVETLEHLQKLIPDPEIELISTAPLYLEEPNAYYFPIDGHINPAGSRALARFLIEEQR